MRACLVAQMVKNLAAMQKMGVWSLDREDPLEMGMATHSSILAWRIPRTEEPGICRATKSWTQLSNKHFHFLPCVYIPHPLYPFLCQWHLDCFHVLTTMNSAALNRAVNASFWITALSRYMFRSRIAEFTLFLIFEEAPNYFP